MENRKLTINRRILKLAIPAIVNNITVPLLGLSDTTISGHLGQTAYIGAIAVGTMMLNVVYWLCGFLRMGTTGLSAQAYGAKNFVQSRNILFKSLIIAGSIAMLVVMFQRPLEHFLLSVISPDAEVRQFASQYFRICVWTAPAQLAIMAISGWFIGMQNTVVPMVVAIGINVINIALSLTLVFGFDIGFRGVAIGTLSANWIGVIAAMMFVRSALKRYKGGEIGSTVGWKRFFSVNTDLFFRSACIMSVSLSVTAVGSRLGETTLAANAVMMQFFIFFSYFMDGFAFAGEAIVGSAEGAGDRSGVKRGVHALLIWGAMMAALFFLVYLFGSMPISSLITDNAQVLDAVRDMRVWIIILPPVTVGAFIFDGVFIGLARTRVLLVATLLATATFFSILFLHGGVGNLPENSGLWIAFESYLLLRGVLLALEYVKIQRK